MVVLRLSRVCGGARSRCIVRGKGAGRGSCQAIESGEGGMGRTLQLTTGVGSG